MNLLVAILSGLGWILTGIFLALWICSNIRRAALHKIVYDKIDRAIYEAVGELFNIDNSVECEVLEVNFGRTPYQAESPELYPPNGFNYAVIKFPKEMFAIESEGTVSTHFATPNPTIRVIKPEKPIGS